MNGSSFSGIVECDDKQLDINEKGKRNLNRDAYKRPSDRTTKRGVSNDKVSIMVALDRKGNSVMRVQHVNSMDNLYERWIKPFYGVAIKYLPQYLNWFVFQEKIKEFNESCYGIGKISHVKY